MNVFGPKCQFSVKADFPFSKSSLQGHLRTFLERPAECPPEEKTDSVDLIQRA